MKRINRKLLPALNRGAALLVEFKATGAADGSGELMLATAAVTTGNLPDGSVVPLWWYRRLMGLCVARIGREDLEARAGMRSWLDAVISQHGEKKAAKWILSVVAFTNPNTPEGEVLCPHL